MPTIDRMFCCDWFRRNRRRSRAWFDMIAPEAYEARPIALRHPIVFYEGHLPAFNVNTLVKQGLGQKGLDADLERLFERGIDPAEETLTPAAGEASGSQQPPASPSAQRQTQGSDGRAVERWPARDDVLRFADATDKVVSAALAQDTVDRADNPVLRNGLAVYTILEHEAMHHETLLYMFHCLPLEQKVRPPGYRPEVGGEPPPAATVRIPAGSATLGASREHEAFGWDNEFPAYPVRVSAFEIDVYDVTNRDYLAFVEAGGYRDPASWTPESWAWRERNAIEHPSFWVRRDERWFWRTIFDEVPLPPAWPVFVSHAEASAYARWKGRRLPTEAEYHRAAFGSPEGRERRYPWGDHAPRVQGNFSFRSWDPIPVGASPASTSAWGVHDLVGNGWEWTSTVFAGFPGFRPMASYPRYSADFFDGRHYVLKGASHATALELIRPSFRNWFRPHYPYPYATFRCVTS